MTCRKSSSIHEAMLIAGGDLTNLVASVLEKDEMEIYKGLWDYLCPYWICDGLYYNRKVLHRYWCDK